MNDVKTLTVEIPRAAIESVAREVFESMFAHLPSDSEAESTRQTIARIQAKQLITIAELEVLLNCSRGYIGKLVEQADAGTSEHPIPYCDLSGLIMFEPAAVMDWARAKKPLQRKARKQGGKKHRSHLREIKQTATG
jgi:hypothetical protein